MADYKKRSDSFILEYPCPEPYECSSYNFVLPKGKYLLELYGASGGSVIKTTSMRLKNNSCIDQSIVEQYNGNTVCNPINSGGSGAYISGILYLKKETKLYANIGVNGSYSSIKGVKALGGYNGGGHSLDYVSGSGGGATDIRVDVDDVYHRIIVAGGGGGSDNYYFDTDTLKDDGTGGSGGYPEGQSFWFDGEYYENGSVASQLYGFSFGIGESAGAKTAHPNSTHLGIMVNDIAGAGGGWYGGFVGGHANCGSGGGSSFILTEKADIPEGEIIQYDDRYEKQISKGKYAFSRDSEYAMFLAGYANGIWYGNGKIKITVMSAVKCSIANRQYKIIQHIFILFMNTK